jgi:peptidoglycan hydrolase-like protein with peptidoglycan-binding domain
MRRSLAVGAAALGAALLLGTPAGAALLNPMAPMPAPAQVEGFSPYLPQVSCDPVVKPGTEALRTLLLDTYGGRDLGITRSCAVGSTSEHKEGRAFDWGLNVTVPAEKAIADQFLGWLLEAGPDGLAGYNARRLGVMYVIWNARIWGAYSAATGWKAYTGAEAHTDHIHISLSWAGAMKETSFWTGEAAPVDYGPCREYIGLPASTYSVPRTSSACPPPVSPMTLTGSPVLAQGDTGPYVAQLQSRLKISADGVFGSKTAAALTAFQTANGLAATGRTDAATWTRLRAPVVAPPAAPATPATPPVAVSPVPVAVSLPVDRALVPYAGKTLAQGARGAAVVALQKALRITSDGDFGPKTAAAVLAFNKAHGLTADAVVRPATWLALGAPPAPAGKAGARRWIPATR